MRAEDIADVLGADADTVVRMCDVALGEVAGGIGLPGDDLDRTRALVAELPSESWPGAKTNGHNGVAAIAIAPNGAGAATANGEAPGGIGAEAPTVGEPSEIEAPDWVGDFEVES